MHKTASAHCTERETRRGFTLIELMIVVAVIAVVAAMAIPSLIQSRITAHEASAINTLRTLTTVNQQYRTRFGNWAGGLTPLFSSGYIDDKLATGVKSGYTFTYALVGGDDYAIIGDPTTPGTTGQRYFFVDQSGVIRFSTTATATVASMPVQ